MFWLQLLIVLPLLAIMTIILYVGGFICVGIYAVITHMYIYKLYDNEKIMWREEEYFDITFQQRDYDPSTVYSDTIVVDDKEYRCNVYIGNGVGGGPNDFLVTLYDPNEGKTIDYYKGTSERDGWDYDDFLYGVRDTPKIVLNKEYRYITVVTLEGGDYVEYCKDNGIEYPEQIILKGYKTKKVEKNKN